MSAPAFSRAATTSALKPCRYCCNLRKIFPRHLCMSIPRCHLDLFVLNSHFKHFKPFELNIRKYCQQNHSMNLQVAGKMWDLFVSKCSSQTLWMPNSPRTRGKLTPWIKLQKISQLTMSGVLPSLSARLMSIKSWIGGLVFWGSRVAQFNSQCVELVKNARKSQLHRILGSAAHWGC